MTKGDDSPALPWPVGWPRTPPHKRERGRFAERSYYAAQQGLMLQLRAMGATDLRIDTLLNLRSDGLPYANQRRPDDPGVVVSFRIYGRPHVWALDKYDRAETNLWAICKTLEAKRAITRWGATTGEREFAGYAALPPGSGVTEGVVQAEPEPHVILGVHPGASQAAVKAAFRALATVHHPDRGGDPERFQALVRARNKMLDLEASK